jgi:uncharacterized protein (TIGR03118 family)
MKDMRMSFPAFNYSRTAVCLFLGLALSAGCKKTAQDETASQLQGPQMKMEVKAKRNFDQVNLVGDNNEYSPARIDPTLVNAWGIAWNPAGIPWINSEDGHVSEVYTAEGAQVRPGVNIPSPTAATGGLPTGIVFSGSATNFLLPAPNSLPARFIFVGVDGVISAWNPTAGNNAVMIMDNSATSAYTGLAIATNAGSQYLYAANFRTGHIDVFNNSFTTVSMPFTDPNLPAGYSPFNIQEVGGMLYVTYAKVGANGRSVAGMGLGYVDIYTTAGALVDRFVSGGQLNAPWGVAKAPASFFGDDGEATDIILIGNFGNGRINAYKSDGKFYGELWSHDEPIEIEGLWAISFPPATATSVDPSRLYFAAGPDDEEHGLFGYIKK